MLSHSPPPLQTKIGLQTLPAVPGGEDIIALDYEAPSYLLNKLTDFSEKGWAQFATTSNEVSVICEMKKLY